MKDIIETATKFRKGKLRSSEVRRRCVFRLGSVKPLQEALRNAAHAKWRFDSSRRLQRLIRAALAGSDAFEPGIFLLQPRKIQAGDLFEVQLEFPVGNDPVEDVLDEEPPAQNGDHPVAGLFENPLRLPDPELRQEPFVSAQGKDSVDQSRQPYGPRAVASIEAAPLEGLPDFRQIGGVQIEKVGKKFQVVKAFVLRHGDFVKTPGVEVDEAFIREPLDGEPGKAGLDAGMDRIGNEEFFLLHEDVVVKELAVGRSEKISGISHGNQNVAGTAEHSQVRLGGRLIEVRIPVPSSQRREAFPGDDRAVPDLQPAEAIGIMGFQKRLHIAPEFPDEFRVVRPVDHPQFGGDGRKHDVLQRRRSSFSQTDMNDHEPSLGFV